MKKIKEWLNKLLSGSDEVSIKRVTGGLSFILFTTMVIDHLITKQLIQVELIYGSLGLTTACFGLNAWIDTTKIKSNEK